MQFLKQSLAFVFSRQMLVFVAIVLLALLIWFLGPLLAVDGLRPLASIGVRVSFIVLLLVLAILWLAGGPISLVGVAAACLLTWHAGPLLSLGSTQPLAPLWARVALIGVILLACALYWLYRLLRAMTEDREFLAKVFSADKSGNADNAAKAELKTIAEKINAAVKQLKRLRSVGGLRRLVEGKRYLYELPWYMIVGSPAAGKTTALANSGLQFSVSPAGGKAPKSMALGSSAGTMQCDWWFTNEAVLIDTAGRYTIQDSQADKDGAEWIGFLGLLRKHRTRAPINGVIVALNAAQLLEQTDEERSQNATIVRERLAELRRELGIRFPVYVVVTKLDLLRGFGEYFQSLTSEGRAQTWGFTLPFDGGKRMKATQRVAAADIVGHREALHEQLGTELSLLQDRLAAGLRARLNEEFDIDRRKRLFALPEEFAGLIEPLVQSLDAIFLDSRFDDTQLHNTLRGVYLTSGAQATIEVPADAHTLMQRLEHSLGRGKGQRQGQASAGSGGNAASSTRGQRGFFLQDVLTKIVIPEAHLVRPNLRWEFRFRVLRLLGHALAIVAFLSLAGALALSFGNNRQYLATVAGRTQHLSAEVGALFADFKPTVVPDVLSSARELPGYSGLDTDNPPGSYLYGLYAAPPVMDAADATYARLQEHLLLPTIMQRIEAVLAQSVAEHDAKRAYETLRVYKLLHDKDRYLKQGGASAVRNWVLKDWETTDSAAAFGGRASMVGHVQALFSGAHAVQAASLPNEALVHDAQAFLDGNTSTQRVYERAKAAMLDEAPEEFTLVRAVGPQAGTVFSRIDGLPLERGVPGLFTYDGYHELFNKRLPEFVGQALEDDAWVMGRTVDSKSDAARKGLDAAAGHLRSDLLLEDIRRQYLNEYAQHWDDFLNSIRTVGGIEGTGTSLGFDLTVLRQFAAPDSPLARLARAAARETTLSRPLVTRAPEENKSLLDKASDELSKRTAQIGANLGARSEERLEKQLVDNRFAALREVVTGQPDIGAISGTAASGVKPGLEAISGLVNEYYTLLVVADTALSAGGLPPGGADVGAKLKLEAGKLPAPFREVLTALAVSGGEKVASGSTDILRKQAQVQLDRIMGLMALQVSEPCKRGVEGRYPLAAVAQDASIDDFTQVFAVGGSADEFFTKYLAPFVDTSVRPWRYKSPGTANMMVGVEAAANGATQAPATTGPTLLGELLKLLAQNGPNLEAFYRAQQIRELFFKEAGGRKLAWKLDLRVAELEPSITDLIIDIDGQGQRYVHGPQQTLSINWPGPRGGAMAELVANPRVSGAS